MKPLSLYRGQSEFGIGEGPNLPVRIGEQYLAADDFLNEAPLLAAIRPWLTLDAPPQAHAQLRANLEGWSLFDFHHPNKGHHRVVVRLTEAARQGVIDDRPTYFAHGLVWPMTEEDAGVYLGMREAFAPPWPTATSEPPPPLPPARFRADLREEKDRARRFLMWLLHACIQDQPIAIVMDNWTEFSSTSPLPLLLAFARLGLPTRFHHACNIRILTSNPSLFLSRKGPLGQHAARVVVIHQSYLGDAIAASAAEKRTLLVLDKMGNPLSSGVSEPQAERLYSVLLLASAWKGRMEQVAAVARRYDTLLPPEARESAWWKVTYAGFLPVIPLYWALVDGEPSIRVRALIEASTKKISASWDQILVTNDLDLPPEQLVTLYCTLAEQEIGLPLKEKVLDHLKSQQIDNLPEAAWATLPPGARLTMLHRLWGLNILSKAGVVKLSQSVPLSEILGSEHGGWVLSMERGTELFKGRAANPDGLVRLASRGTDNFNHLLSLDPDLPSVVWLPAYLAMCNAPQLRTMSELLLKHLIGKNMWAANMMLVEAWFHADISEVIPKSLVQLAEVLEKGQECGPLQRIYCSEIVHRGKQSRAKDIPGVLEQITTSADRRLVMDWYLSNKYYSLPRSVQKQKLSWFEKYGWLADTADLLEDDLLDGLSLETLWTLSHLGNEACRVAFDRRMADPTTRPKAVDWLVSEGQLQLWFKETQSCDTQNDVAKYVVHGLSGLAWMDWVKAVECLSPLRAYDLRALSIVWRPQQEREQLSLLLKQCESVLAVSELRKKLPSGISKPTFEEIVALLPANMAVLFTWWEEPNKAPDDLLNKLGAMKSNCNIQEMKLYKQEFGELLLKSIKEDIIFTINIAQDLELKPPAMVKDVVDYIGGPVEEGKIIDWTVVDTFLTGVQLPKDRQEVPGRRAWALKNKYLLVAKAMQGEDEPPKNIVPPRTLHHSFTYLMGLTKELRPWGESFQFEKEADKLRDFFKSLSVEVSEQLRQKFRMQLSQQQNLHSVLLTAITQELIPGLDLLKVLYGESVAAATLEMVTLAARNPEYYFNEPKWLKALGESVVQYSEKLSEEELQVEIETLLRAVEHFYPSFGALRDGLQSTANRSTQ